MIEPLFVFALTWSFGCTTDLEGKQKFDRKLWVMMKDSSNQFPSNGYVYDYFYNMEKKEWIIWTETVSKY